MNLKFWKKKAPADAEEGDTDGDKTVAIPREAEASEEESVRPGLLARVRNALFALRKPRDSSTEAGDGEAETHGRDKPAAADRGDAEEPLVVPVRNLKKRLIIGGMLGAVVLLLAGIGLTAWTLLAPKHAEQNNSPAAAHNTATTAAKATGSAAMQAQIEALKQQNAKMLSELEAMKKTGQDETPAAAGKEDGAAKTAGGDVLLFSGKDTKASAAALKQAIEEMNAESEGRKPRKTAP
ncbi:hypothetical protein SKTS_11710 [Sulfurimicrobium lacus]|uniref:Uncharacterized protein n=1 Tax=Sulfurimicrobium lacus TaxID=2715678 RepID=A0A6F8VC01_9PROT|nr:hypothetical protein [Sulfurimicrobium lacus]BCB26285.1 hypothetical protein SKTS_11710 [Sulfurimicrobium lacus]